MTDETKNRLLKIFKVLGIIVAVFLLLVVVGFGLLVGFCALSSRR